VTVSHLSPPSARDPERPQGVEPARAQAGTGSSRRVRRPEPGRVGASAGWNRVESARPQAGTGSSRRVRRLEPGRVGSPGTTSVHGAAPSPPPADAPTRRGVWARRRAVTSAVPCTCADSTRRVSARQHGVQRRLVRASTSRATGESRVHFVANRTSSSGSRGVKGSRRSGSPRSMPRATAVTFGATSR
jgi:hypothetical protein